MDLFSVASWYAAASDALNLDAIGHDQDSDERPPLFPHITPLGSRLYRHMSLPPHLAAIRGDLTRTSGYHLHAIVHTPTAVALLRTVTMSHPHSIMTIRMALSTRAKITTLNTRMEHTSFLPNYRAMRQCRPFLESSLSRLSLECSPSRQSSLSSPYRQSLESSLSRLSLQSHLSRLSSLKSRHFSHNSSHRSRLLRNSLFKWCPLRLGFNSRPAKLIWAICETIKERL